MPVLDPTQIARDACAARFDAIGAHHTANRYREGSRDDCGFMDVARRAAEMALASRPDDETPIPVVLFCPLCLKPHIDAPDPAVGWENLPHRSHKCLNPECGCIWRPADVATSGVAYVESCGKSDTWPADEVHDATIADLQAAGLLPKPEEEPFIGEYVDDNGVVCRARLPKPGEPEA